MERITDSKISGDPSRGSLIEIEWAEGRSANCPVYEVHPIAHCRGLRRTDDSQISFTRSAPQATEIRQFALRLSMLVVLLLPLFSVSARSQSSPHESPSQNETARAEE